VILIVPVGTCVSDAEALAVVVAGGVGVGVPPTLGVAVAVVVAVAVFVAVGCGVTVGDPPGEGVGTFGVELVVGGVAMGLLMVTEGVSAAMRDANDRDGAAPAAGAASSASNVTPSARPRVTVSLADIPVAGSLRPLIPHSPPHPQQQRQSRSQPHMAVIPSYAYHVSHPL
jgi:hypothetical protein